MASRVAALIECMSLRNPGLTAIAATGMSVSQANTLLAFIDHTIRGHTHRVSAVSVRTVAVACGDRAGGEQHAL